jgi:two-component system response regulator (stage 0 sporulation protein F)
MMEVVVNKILVLDDDKAIQMLYAEELYEDGWDVATTGDFSRVMQSIEKERPDVVVMDIGPGDHNGLEVLQGIRNSDYDLPVILCMDYPAFKDDVKSIGADYYVVKGRDLSDLKSTVELAMEGGHVNSKKYEDPHRKESMPMAQMKSGLE